MTPEQYPEIQDTDQQAFDVEQDKNSSNQVEFDPYHEAMKIYEMVIEFLKQRGELHRPSEIQNEYKLDNHFDDLASVYKRTILFLGLDWPPPTNDDDVLLIDDEN